MSWRIGRYGYWWEMSEVLFLSGFQFFGISTSSPLGVRGEALGS